MKYLYYRYLYRPLMKLAHRYDWHHMEQNPHIEPGKIHLWCHWCGVRSVINQPSTSPTILTGNENDSTK